MLFALTLMYKLTESKQQQATNFSNISFKTQSVQIHSGEVREGTKISIATVVLSTVYAVYLSLASCLAVWQFGLSKN